MLCRGSAVAMRGNEVKLCHLHMPYAHALWALPHPSQPTPNNARLQIDWLTCDVGLALPQASQLLGNDVRLLVGPQVGAGGLW